MLRTALRAMACCALLWAGPAAALTFDVNPLSSFLGVENATLDGVPGFETTLEPVAPDDWVRQLSGTFEADGTTGALESAAIQILGGPLAGDQIRIDDRGNPRDLGDIVLAALAFSVDAAGMAMFTAGTLDYDLSLGNKRISSPFPFPAAGIMSSNPNTGAPPMVVGSIVTIPILLTFENLPIEGGLAGFQLVGSLSGTVVPEPATGMLAVLGLASLGVRGQGRRR